MPRFAPNLTMMFREYPFLDRFAAAADAGFTAVECQFPYEAAPDAIAAALSRHGLDMVLFNLPPGKTGEWGLAALAGREQEFAASLEKARPYVEACGVRRLHLMAGNASSKDPAAGRALRAAIATACAFFPAVNILLEPLNRRDMPGYFLDDFGTAERLIGEMGLPNLALQFDIYHRQILHGDVATALSRLLPIIGHIQVASVPDRAEPGTGELDDAYLFRLIDGLGYQGFVGCEYWPKVGTKDGLAWAKKLAAPEPSP